MPQNPFLLAADDAPALRTLLRKDPAVGSRQDEHGYSLLHAAASYDHVALLKSLVGEFGVDVNLKDEDGETCLFVAESVAVATCLVEELQIDTSITNDDGLTAVEKMEDEGEYLEVASYLRRRDDGVDDRQEANQEANLGAGDFAAPIAQQTHPPRLPDNITIDLNTISSHLENDLTEEPDPEFKKRIEDLAAKEDFHGEERQSELRALVTDAIKEVTAEERSSRIRLR